MSGVVVSTRIPRSTRAVIEAIAEANEISTAEWLRRKVLNAVREEASIVMEVAGRENDR